MNYVSTGAFYLGSAAFNAAKLVVQVPVQAAGWIYGKATYAINAVQEQYTSSPPGSAPQQKKIANRKILSSDSPQPNQLNRERLEGEHNVREELPSNSKAQNTGDNEVIKMIDGVSVTDAFKNLSHNYKMLRETFENLEGAIHSAYEKVDDNFSTLAVAELQGDFLFNIRIKTIMRNNGLASTREVDEILSFKNKASIIDITKKYLTNLKSEGGVVLPDIREIIESIKEVEQNLTEIKKQGEASLTKERLVEFENRLSAIKNIPYELKRMIEVYERLYRIASELIEDDDSISTE